MEKFEIGQEIIIDEDYTIQSVLTGKLIQVRKGDKGFLDANGNIHIRTGDARGKIVPFIEKERVSGYDIQNIAEMIYKRLDGEFEIGDYMDDCGVEKEDIVNTLEDLLMDIF